MNITLSSNVRLLPGIGPAAEQGLARAGITTVGGLIDLMPRSYNDYSKPLSFSEISENGEGFFAVSVCSGAERYIGKSGVQVLSFVVADENGQRASVTLFNQSYLQSRLRPGGHVFLHGSVTRSGQLLHMTAPRIFTAKPVPPYLPIYASIEGLAPSKLRRAIRLALDTVPINDHHSRAFLKRYDLPGLAEAYRSVHFPESIEEAERGLRRFRLDERFLLLRMLDGIAARRDTPNETAVDAFNSIGDYVGRLQFKPTDAQLRAMEEIASDLAGPLCMNRLLQGDVGSGKTAVALFAAYAVMRGGYQAMMLVPTEVLARQHMSAAQKILPENSVFLLTGQSTETERNQVLQRIRERGNAGSLLIGTHALLYGDRDLPTPALLITDEQHRFGVRQRQKLLNQEHGVHSLTMSATPIPRSLALAVHGQTNVSILDESPPGRKPTRTSYVPQHKIQDMFGFLAERARSGMQSFVVCPAVEHVDESALYSAVETHRQLCERFPDIKIGLLHGKCTPEHKAEVMSSFVEGETSILVATTVIEVGVDVPNATAMAVMDAERFGLAQLHQLRGRVGRGNKESYCFLVSSAPSAARRIRVMCMTNDGFRIAEEDLKERGAGEFLGEKQHGKSNALNLLTEENSEVLAHMRHEMSRISVDPEYAQDFQWFTCTASKQLPELLSDLALN